MNGIACSALQEPNPTYTQMCNGCRCLLTVHEWPAVFRPYALGYQPCSGKHRVSTRANQELKSSPIPKPVEGKEACIVTKKKPAVPKYRRISAIRDFPPIHGRFNPHLSDEKKQAMHTHLTQILDEYARLELEEIRLLKTGALPEGFDCKGLRFSPTSTRSTRHWLRMRKTCLRTHSRNDRS
jgi:hypothetical protein